jgi:hypothetical protein
VKHTVVKTRLIRKGNVSSETHYSQDSSDTNGERVKRNTIWSRLVRYIRGRCQVGHNMVKTRPIHEGNVSSGTQYGQDSSDT